MAKKVMLRLGLFMVILFLTVPAFSGSSNAVDFSADMVNKLPMGEINGKNVF